MQAQKNIYFFEENLREESAHGYFLCVKGNHLGNVLTVISDKKLPHESTSTPGTIDYYTADIKYSRDYGPFGEYLANRVVNPGEYLNSFNGKRDEEELDGWQDYGARGYLKYRRGFDRVDPLTKRYPYLTPYAFAENDVIRCVDLDGLEKAKSTTPSQNLPNGNTAAIDKTTAGTTENYANQKFKIETAPPPPPPPPTPQATIRAGKTNLEEAIDPSVAPETEHVVKNLLVQTAVVVAIAPLVAPIVEDVSMYSAYAYSSSPTLQVGTGLALGVLYNKIDASPDAPLVGTPTTQVVTQVTQLYESVKKYTNQQQQTQQQSTGNTTKSTNNSKANSTNDSSDQGVVVPKNTYKWSH